LLSVARLTDASKGTLSLRRLPKLVKPTAKADVEAKLRVAIDRCAFAQDWRHRRIAHNDFQLMTNPKANPLSDASRLQVSKALESIVAVLDAVSQPHLGTTNMFDWKGGPAARGAAALLYVLDDGVRAEREWLERFKRGEVGIAETQQRMKRDL
jgi:hypothetical protein